MSHLRTLQWKKNRKFGDVHGGRRWKKLNDNIFARLHSITRPSEFDDLPILMEDNPSRDYFHPISAEDACEAIKQLPNNAWKGITHIWCRRVRLTEDNFKPFAEFICGSGVRVIILYAWPRKLEYTFTKRPSGTFATELSKIDIKIKARKTGYFIKPNVKQLKLLYVQSFLFHEVGHHLDWYSREWSKANNKILEDQADQYAMQLTEIATEVVNNLTSSANE